MSASPVQEPSEASVTIFKLLTSARFTEKYLAIDRLDGSSAAIDRPLLRSLVLNGLRNEFSVETEETYEDHAIGDIRSWLLSALGRVSSDDPEATEEIRKTYNGTERA